LILIVDDGYRVEQARTPVPVLVLSGHAAMLAPPEAG
jgi:hypothetical protein